MAFIEERLPTTISYGSRGGPTWRNTGADLDSGASESVQRWVVPKHVYDLRWGVRTLDDFQDLRDFWLTVGKGSLNGWRLKDQMDFTSRPVKPDKHIGAHGFSNVQIGVGDGSETKFQLIKLYKFGNETLTRTIKKPVAGTLLISFDDVEQTSGFSLDSTTGIVTFTSAPGVSVVIKAGFEFDVPCKFDRGLDAAFKPSLKAFKAADLPQIGCEEQLGDVVSPQRFYYGGGKAITLTADSNVEFANGRVQVFDTTVAYDLFLPDLALLEKGAPYFFFHNRASSVSLVFKTFDGGSTIATLTSGQKAIAYIYDNAGVDTWALFGV